MISDYSLSEKEIDEIWESYREISSLGISMFTDDEIRNLHARLNYVLSCEIIRLGDLEKTLAAYEVALNSTIALLMHTKYTEYTTVKKNEYAMGTDEKYLSELGKRENVSVQVIGKKAEVNALEKACMVLSREISYRIKGN